MASIEKRSRAKGDVWRVQWVHGGRGGDRRDVTMVTEKHAKAAKALIDARNQDITREEVYRLILGIDPEANLPKPPTFAEWVSTWVAAKRDTQRDTLKDYVDLLAIRVSAYMGEKRMTADEINPDLITDWLLWLGGTYRTKGGKALSPNTIRKTHAILYQVLGSAVPRWLPSNPVARPAGAGKTPGLPKQKRYRATYLEPVEAELLLACCDERIHDLAYVMLHTGLRLGEVLVLRVCDVNVADALASPHLRVERGLKRDHTIGDPKSERSNRTVDVSTRVAALLRGRAEGKPRTALLFPSPRGGTHGAWSENNLRDRHWRPAVAAARRCPEHPPAAPRKPLRGPARQLRDDEVSTCDCGGRLHKTPRMHDLRHTHAAWLIASKEWDPYEIQLRMGHESISTTYDVYGHLMSPRDSAARIRSLDKLVGWRSGDGGGNGGAVAGESGGVAVERA